MTNTETEATDVLDEIEAAIRSGRSMGLGAWAILNRVQRLATPTPARSEAAGGEENEGPEWLVGELREYAAETNGYGSSLARVAAHEILSLRQQLATAEKAKDDAVGWIGTVRDELVLAGFPGGDRTVALANLRALIQQLAAVEARYDQIAAATDEAVRAGEELARAVLDMDTWGIAGSNFDSALRLTDIETLNRLRHLASKVIPAAQDDTTGGASDK